MKAQPLSTGISRDQWLVWVVSEFLTKPPRVKHGRLRALNPGLGGGVAHPAGEREEVSNNPLTHLLAPTFF